MVFAAEGHRAGQFRCFQSIFNHNLQSLKFLCDTRRPAVSKRVGQNFKPLKTLFKKKHLRNTSDHLWCVISSNLKHYHSSILGD